MKKTKQTKAEIHRNGSPWSWVVIAAIVALVVLAGFAKRYGLF